MSILNDTPMYGQVTINWSAGVDEYGEVRGYIGVPEKPGELFDNEGATLAFREPITGYADAQIRWGIQLTLQDAINRELVPLVIPPMLEAIKELRERQGGFQPEQGEDEPKEG